MLTKDVVSTAEFK